MWTHFEDLHSQVFISNMNKTNTNHTKENLDFFDELIVENINKENNNSYHETSWVYHSRLNQCL